MLVGAKPIGTVGFMAGIPCMLTPFWWSSVQMVQYNQEVMCDEGTYIEYIKAGCSDHAAARNSMVKRMRGDWIVMLDTDHKFEPDLIGRMLYWAEEGECDVLTGFYQYKCPPHSPVLYLWNEEEDLPNPIASWDNEADIFQVGSAGGGCLLVRRKIFDRMSEEMPGEEPFDHIGKLSEDHSFFHRCKDLEIEVWCCPKIQSNHLAIKPIMQEDFMSDMIDVKKVKVQGKKQ